MFLTNINYLQLLAVLTFNSQPIGQEQVRRTDSSAYWLRLNRTRSQPIG